MNLSVSKNRKDISMEKKKALEEWEHYWTQKRSSQSSFKSNWDSHVAYYQANCTHHIILHEEKIIFLE